MAFIPPKYVMVRLPRELSAQVDAARPSTLSREAFVRRAVEAALTPPAPPPRAAPKVDRVMEAHRALPKPRRADYATGEQWQDAVRVWKAQR